MGNEPQRHAHNEVTINEQGVVVVVWRGRQTAESVSKVAEDLTVQLGVLRTAGKRALALMDVSALRLSDMTSESRIAGKGFADIAFDAGAIVGNSRIMGVLLYTLRAIKPKTPVRYFNTRRKAAAWLLGTTRVGPARSLLSPVAAITVTLIGLSGLAGWATGNQYLEGFLPGYRIMHPFAACALLVMGFGFWMYWRTKLKYLWMSGIFGIVFGVVALLVFRIDAWLLHGRLAAHNPQYGSADSAAICFILIGIVGYLTGRRHRWVHPVQYALSGTIVLIALCNVFGQLYAHEFAYGQVVHLLMPLPLALAFAIAGSSLILLIIYKEHGDVLGFVTRTGWLIVAALLLVQISAYNSWRQAIDRNKSESVAAFTTRADDIETRLSGRLQSYTDALQGFHGLFAASDYVNQGDFDKYYRAIDLATHYPGLRNVSYIALVKEADIPAFVTARRQDTSLFPAGNPSFTIQSKVNSPVHYIAAYSGENPNNTSLGLDVGSIAGRAELYGAALASGGPYASGTVHFRATASQAAQDGFFISVPVKSASSDTFIGLVNVSFNYNDFFAQLSKTSRLLNGLSVVMYDAETGSKIYSANRAGRPVALAHELTIPVLNQHWRVDVRAPKNFAINTFQARQPASTLVGSQIFSALLLVIFIILGRSRRHAQELAELITEDLQRERDRAVQLQQKDEAVLSSIGDAVFAIDTSRRITLFNPAAQIISGFSASEALGKPYEQILQFISEDTGRPRRDFIDRALSGHLAAMRHSTMLVRKDGNRISVADSAAPIQGQKGKLQGAIVVFRDVSKERALDKAKTEFVSLASHQLRTPLSAVNWYVESMLHGDVGKLNETQIEYLQEVYRGNQRMVELVSSLLDVSRLDLGRMVNKPQPTDLGALVKDIQKELKPSIEAKHQRVVARVEPKLPDIYGDPKLLRMIVQNLMSNAVKYTPEKGTVEATVRRAKLDDLSKAKLHHGGPFLFLSVKDTGYGIPKEQQGKIFQKLFRADNVRKMDMEGTGLGLYIVKQVAEKLGGEVWFESIESAGTTFYVVLPLKTIVYKLKDGDI